MLFIKTPNEDELDHLQNLSSSCYITPYAGEVTTTQVIRERREWWCFVKSARQGLWLLLQFTCRPWISEAHILKTTYATEFVNLRLSADQKDALEKWVVDNEVDFADYLLNLVESGYKVSLNTDEQANCFLVAVTGTLPSCLNKGLTMTSRAKTPLDALWMAFYKYYVVCEGGVWERYKQDSSGWG